MEWYTLYMEKRLEEGPEKKKGYLSATTITDINF